MLPVSCYAFFCALTALGQTGLPDAVFDRIPFEQWLRESGDSHIRWSAEVVPATLSLHQRLGVTIAVRVDGAEFVREAFSFYAEHAL